MKNNIEAIFLDVGNTLRIVVEDAEFQSEAKRGLVELTGAQMSPDDFFDFLEEHINNNVRERGEFQLTSALDRLRREGGFLGLLMNGQRFDIGLPEHYLETLQTYSK